MSKKSARYEFNYELPDDQTPRVNLRKIPGGKKSMKGGTIITDGRGNLKDTNEAVKKMDGAGIFSSVGDILDNIIGTGKKPAPKGKKCESKTTTKGAGILEDLAPLAPLALALGKKKPAPKGKKGGNVTMAPMSTNITETQIPSKGGKKILKASGLFSDIGQAIDSVGDAIGLGKKSMRGGNIGGVKESVAKVEAGMKQLKKLMKKVK